MENSQSHKCQECGQECSTKSNLTRHMRSHAAKELECEVCKKRFTLKQNLERHSRIHLYPEIRLFKEGEALLNFTKEAKAVAKEKKKEVDPI